MVQEDDSTKPLKEGELRVQIKAVGLNFADIFAAMGLYSATPKGTFTPGLEFSGTILEVHPSAASAAAAKGTWVPRAGCEVMGVTRFGGYTTVLNVP
eukprot:CAMPEP_0173402774 /NCGR_PEP_ID=MMETSP1356-20130122/54889_1 /TAXON_ID=77927 ORGANISM="Hemiselmis virescens, Strain PCC157" /NCGR_SAMPLE_ID=MMETSP1356 /ASSEMBLY_ACC=CAM_ASM_000847 /LENGTH=96 /DNA_ID=CAMNT_0014363169 /DNA_START=141 /DNA_END=428 /DNA_ORIENTATION=+